MESTYDDEKRIAYLSSGQIVYSVHKSTSCLGDVCPLHKPSDHVLRIFPLVYEPTSYHFYRDVFGTNVLDPDDYILNRDGKALVRNAATCLKCFHTVESTFRHDFRHCHCGNVFVDGGLSYIRHGANDMNMYKNESKTIFLTDYDLS